MSGAYWLSLLLAASDLTVTSETPDAHCPSLEQARSAVLARVGHVEGGPFVAKYSVVRDAQARKAIVLVLSGSDGEVLLERRIALSAGDCAVAAQTLALIIERYFDGVGADQSIETQVPDAPSETTDVPKTEVEALKEEENADGTTENPSVQAPPATALRFEATDSASGALSTTKFGSHFRLGGGIDSNLAPALSAGWGYRFHEHAQLGVDVVVPVTSHATEESDTMLSGHLSSLYVGVLLRTELCAEQTQGALGCSLGAGPVVGLHLDRVVLEGESVQIEANRARALGSAGLQAQFSVDFSERWGLDLTARGVGHILGRPFVIQEVSGTQTEVAQLPRLGGDAILSLGFHR